MKLLFSVYFNNEIEKGVIFDANTKEELYNNHPLKNYMDSPEEEQSYKQIIDTLWRDLNNIIKDNGNVLQYPADDMLEFYFIIR